MLKYSAKLITAATLSLTYVNAEETQSNQECESAWCLGGKYEANLSHVGCFADGSCGESETQSHAIDEHLLMTLEKLRE